MKKFVINTYLTLAVLALGCSEKQSLSLVSVEELYPIKVGKTFIYRLDSTILANANQNLITKSYLAKDSVESNFLDLQGRNSFRIFRYIRDIAQTKPWQYSFTYAATVANNRVEFVDNNLRFITLASPVGINTQWGGTQLINTISPSPFAFYGGWNFEYQNIDEPFTTLKGVIQNTYTVFHQDETLPNVPFNANNYQERSASKEVYAKGIGLIYKEFIRWQYQPPSAPNKFYQEGSYGIKLNLIDYK